MKNILFFLLLGVAFIGCSAQSHRSAVQNDDKDRISVGTVQREIKIGMSSSDVIAVLGAPNMVTTDTERRENWVYDKVATIKVYSSSSTGGGIGAGGLGSGSSGGGILGFLVGGSSKAGASSSSQRTLTIIIKFDHQGMVRDFSYRQSSF